MVEIRRYGKFKRRFSCVTFQYRNILLLNNSTLKPRKKSVKGIFGNLVILGTSLQFLYVTVHAIHRNCWVHRQPLGLAFQVFFNLKDFQTYLWKIGYPIFSPFYFDSWFLKLMLKPDEFFFTMFIYYQKKSLFLCN